MKIEMDIIGQTAVAYFGRTSASISHELKNALAIIRENAGLMDDYLAMAERGVPIDPVKFKQLTGRIHSQTLRADTLIKNMNRFAHSVDEPMRKVNLNEWVELLAALAHREAAMRQVALQVAPWGAPVELMTNPYLLLTLLGHCLTLALSAVTAGSQITLKVLPAQERGVQFELLKGLATLPPDHFSDARAASLAKVLGAEYKVDGAAETLRVTLT
jgi:signal transduction histidine kinase